jgi:hypothetical protein
MFGACGKAEPQSRPHPGPAFFSYQRVRPTAIWGHSEPRNGEAGIRAASGRQSRLFLLYGAGRFLGVLAVFRRKRLPERGRVHAVDGHDLPTESSVIPRPFFSSIICRG